MSGIDLLTLKKARESAADVVETLRYKMAKNKWDGTFVSGIVLLNDGNLVTAPDSYVAIVRIEPGKTYTVTKYPGGNRFRVGLFAERPTLDKLPMAALYYYNGISNSSKQSHTFTNENGALWVVVSVNYNDPNTNTPNVQVEEGARSTDYADPYETRAANFSDLRIGTLVNLSDVIDFRVSEGKLVISEGAFIIDHRDNALISVPPVTWDVFQGGYQRRQYVLYYDLDKNALGWTRVDIYNIPPNCIILGTFIFQGPSGTVETVGIDNYLVDGKPPHRSSQPDEPGGEPTIGEGKRFFVLDHPGTELYHRPDGLESVAEGEPFSLIDSSHTDIYDILDDLVINHPEYVTSTILGEDATGREIREYAFIPETPNNNTNLPFHRIKFCLVAGIHGYEQLSSWALAHFLKDLCENNEEKNFLRFLRWNVDLRVVPVANPWGYDNNARKNSNGVDLNRNFDANWQAHPNPEDDYYSGPSAASEVETQILQQWLDDNRDAVYVIDHHNIASGYPLAYVTEAFSANVAMNVFRSLTRKWRKDHSEAPATGMFGRVSYFTARGTLAAYAGKYTKATTIEAPWKMPYASEKYDKITVECAVDWYGNYLLALCRALL